MHSVARASSRSGTETRQKQHRITFRLSESEYGELEAAASTAGLTIGTYIRSRVLAAAVTRARRRPPVEVFALAKLQGQMNKVGSNIYQLLRHVNFGALPEGDEIRAAFAGYREVIAAILSTLGRGPR